MRVTVRRRGSRLPHRRSPACSALSICAAPLRSTSLRCRAAGHRRPLAHRSIFTLDQVIAFLTAGIVLVQAIAQIGALVVLRRREGTAPFPMPFYPLPAAVALCGWSLAFVYTGAAAIELGVGWLAVGAIVFLAAAKARRWWPFARLSTGPVL